jgi:hypothetical protein
VQGHCSSFVLTRSQGFLSQKVLAGKEISK